MYLLFDIGGTKMRVAGSEDLKTFSEPIKIETPHNFDEAITLLSDAARQIAEGKKITYAGGGVRALDKNKKKLRPHPNFPLWVDKPLHDELEKALGVPISLENDAAVVGLGEAHYGAGEGSKVLAYVTVSTGVGGARLVNGKIDTSIFGFEPGQQVVDIHGEKGASSLEQIISGEGLKKRTGLDPADINDIAVWNEEARILACGLNNIAVMWSPDTIVLGGSMIVKRPGIDIEKVKNYFENILEIFPEKPVIKQAKLGDDGGLYGAMALLDLTK